MSEFVVAGPYGASVGAVSGGRRIGWFSAALMRRRRGFALFLLVAMLVITALAPSIFITIPSGKAGVLWLRFFGGTSLSGPALDEGLHVIFPWDRIFIYDMRLREHDQSYDVIGHDGLAFSINVSFRWRLNRNTLPSLHKEIGPNYLDALLVPEIGSVVRERISRYDTEDLFATRRAQIQREVRNAIVSPDLYNRIGSSLEAKELDSTVVLIDVLFRDIKLPQLLRTAIERKLEQAQISKEYTFRILRERLETERKQIEAQGIQAFQQTVQSGISDNYLKWRGIEATLQLAASQNAKVVIIGNNAQGLPLILNTGDSPVSAPAHAAEAPPPLASRDAENAAQIGGSVNTTPPKPGPIGGSAASERRSTPALVDIVAAAGSAPAPVASSDQPGPSMLQSLIAPFGYRLEPLTPPSLPGWPTFSTPAPAISAPVPVPTPSPFR